MAVADMVFVTTKLNETTEDDEGVLAQWAQDELEDAECSEIAFIAEEDLIDIEKMLTNAALIHGRTLRGDRNEVRWSMHAQLHGTITTNFHGVRIDTCANCRSIISANQYDDYCEEFALK